LCLLPCKGFTLSRPHNLKCLVHNKFKQAFSLIGVELVDRVCLDTNVYCRPRDDQSSKRIRAESGAFLEIVDLVLHGDIKIVSSDYVRFEIEQILDPLKRKDVRGFERTLSSTNVVRSRQLVALAREFSSRCGLNSLDALHVSAACIGKAFFFLTCDDEVLGKKICIERLGEERGYRLKVRNPVNYLQERRRLRRRPLRG